MIRVVTALAATLLSTAPLAHASTDLAPEKPGVVGRVIESHAHAVVLQAAPGETFRLELDSRSVRPDMIHAGDRVRIEFKLLDSGDRLAQRITPIERGTSEWASLDAALNDLETTSGGAPRASQALATTPAVRAANSSDARPIPGRVHAESPRTEKDSRESSVPTASATGAEPQGSSAGWHEVPGTTSALPALFALFVILGALASGLWLVRRLLLRFDGGHLMMTGRDTLSSQRRAS
jgi:hypothetical protein